MRSLVSSLLAFFVLLFAVSSCATTSAGVEEATESETAEETSEEGEEDSDEDEEDEEDDQEGWDEKLEDLEEATGLFKLHHSDSQLLLELDKESLGRDFLYYGALNSGAGSGSVYRGAMLWETEFILRFEKRGDEKIVLIARNARYQDAGDSREQAMLDDVTSEGILRSFDFEAELEDAERYLIDLGSWFLSDNLELADSAPGSGYSVDDDLSLFTNIGAYPRNMEIDQELILSGGKDGNLTQADPGSLLLRVRHSLCALPEEGYKPREFDQRVGYFYTERKDIFDVDSVDPVTRFVNRWRLAKKDPSADVSDPVKPITFWIENSTPKRWRDAVRAGIEAWEPAFRKAGFSNGIVAKQMPEDADWEPGDVRYAVVRWSADENAGFAIGPSRVDPRTGEIFDADITMQESFVRGYGAQFDSYVDDLNGRSKEQIRVDYHAAKDAPPSQSDLHGCKLAGNERQLQAARVMALAGALQPEFDREKFLQAMVTEVVAHEVGHTIGLRHNFKSSTWRPVDELGNVEETAKNGLIGSVMDYNPVNMVPPGTKQGEFFASAPGPYDLWAIEYGYSEHGSNEESALSSIANRSHTNGLDFGTDEDSFIGDALCQVWDLGKNPLDFAEQQIELAEVGLSKLREKGAKDGEGYHRYSRWYRMFTGHYQGSYNGLGRFLGGWTFNRDLVGQEEGRPPITPIDLAMQTRSLDLLCDRGLRWTGGISDADRVLLSNPKFGPFGEWFRFWSMEHVTELVNISRYRILVQLIDGRLYTRLGTQSRMLSGKSETLTPHAVADKVYGAVWVSEPDEHDRWMQSDFLTLVVSELGLDQTPDNTALFNSLLRRVEESCTTYSNSSDRLVAAHGEWLLEKIKLYRNRQMIAF